MINQELIEKLYNSDKERLSEILTSTPSQALPTVTQADVKNTFITRYFVRQVTDKNFIIEVDNVQYEELIENPRFVTAKIKWQIVGKKQSMKLLNGVVIPGVEEINRTVVSEADLTFGGLLKYITSYVEYWFAEEV